MRGKLRIPKSQEDGLVRVLGMSDAELAKLTSSLGSVGYAATVRALSDAVAKETGFEGADAYTVVRALAGLYNVMDSSHTDLPAFVADIERAAKESGSDELEKPPIGWEAAKQRLTTLLSFDKSLGLTAKAFSLLTEAEKVFCEARVMSDIRPIFVRDVNRDPDAFLILHIMHLAFHRHGRLENIDIAMDSSDVKHLVEALNRALAKERSIQGLAERMKTPVISSMAHED